MNALPDLPDVLQSPVANGVSLLLESSIPARLAWVAANGEPRVVPIWFHWSGEHLDMVTFDGAKKLDDITDGTIVAVTIDNETFPYRSLKLRGPVARRAVDGLADEYKASAERYLGAETAKRWLDFLGGAEQVVMSVRPTWAMVSDMAADSPFFQS